jgi:diacylglycerol kinase family enzyme
VAEYDFQIIANLMAGKGESKPLLEKLTRFLEENKQTFRVLTIDKPTPISKLPSDGKVKIKKGVICLGGDGTVSETVGYVLNHKLNVPIALIPTGTANIIATTLGLENRNSFDFLRQNRFKTVDVGVAEYENEKNYFLLGLGLGFEEKFLKLTKEKFKSQIGIFSSKLGVFSYIFAALSELLSLKKIPLTIEADSQLIKTEVCLLTILNLQPLILRFFPLFPHREINCTDGVFNLYYVEYHHYFQALLGTLVFHLLGGRHLGLVKSLCAKKFSLKSAGICGTQLDGELRACLPVKVFFRQEPVRFFVP